MSEMIKKKKQKNKEHKGNHMKSGYASFVALRGCSRGP